MTRITGLAENLLFEWYAAGRRGGADLVCGVCGTGKWSVVNHVFGWRSIESSSGVNYVLVGYALQNGGYVNHLFDWYALRICGDANHGFDRYTLRNRGVEYMA